MNNQKNKEKMELIRKSSPRPQIRLRATVFEDKTKYQRSRVKEAYRREERRYEDA